MIPEFSWLDYGLFVAAISVTALAFGWAGLTIGYRVKVQEASHLEWPARPWWAPRRWLAWYTGPWGNQSVHLEIEGQPVGVPAQPGTLTKVAPQFNPRQPIIKSR